MFCSSDESRLNILVRLSCTGKSSPYKDYTKLQRHEVTSPEIVVQNDSDVTSNLFKQLVAMNSLEPLTRSLVFL